MFHNKVTGGSITNWSTQAVASAHRQVHNSSFSWCLVRSRPSSAAQHALRRRETISAGCFRWQRRLSNDVFVIELKALNNMASTFLLVSALDQYWAWYHLDVEPAALRPGS